MRELQTVIEGLAYQLQRAVAIDDPSIRLLAHTAHAEPVDEHRIKSVMTLRAGPEVSAFVYSLGIRSATAPVRVPGRSDLNLLGRLCVPIRCQGLLLGYLWLIDDDETLTDTEIEASIKAADAAGEILYRSRQLDDLRRGREEQLLLDLVGDGPEAPQPASQTDLDAAGLTAQLVCRVLVVSVQGTATAAETGVSELTLETVLHRHTRRLNRVQSLIATRRAARGYVLVAYRPYEDPIDALRAACEDIRAELVKSDSDDPATDVIIGIGPQVPRVLDARTSADRGRKVIEVCSAVHEYGPVAAWEDLGIFRLLQEFPIDDLADVAIPTGLQKLLELESDQWLLQTLETYLDAAGNVQESARRLHIHRATLYYRLTRIEKLTEMSLADGQDRLALHVGVKFARLMGKGAAPAPEAGAAQAEETNMPS